MTLALCPRRLIVMRTPAFSDSRKRTLVRRADSRVMAGAVRSPLGRLAAAGLPPGLAGGGVTPVMRPTFLPCSSATQRVLLGPAAMWRGPEPALNLPTGWVTLPSVVRRPTVCEANSANQ